MLSEKAFTHKDEDLLDRSFALVKSEMAVVSEWISREEADPDRLLTVFVSPMSDGSIQTACSCLRGTQDLTCIHALDVIRKFRADPNLRAQLFKRHTEATAYRRPQLPTFIDLH